MALPPLHAHEQHRLSHSAALRLPQGAVARTLTALAALTIVSGAMQLANPDGAVAPLGGDLAAAGATARFYVAAIGALLVVFGGLLLHALLSPQPHPAVFLWVGVEKLAYAAMAALGAAQGIYGSAAYGVTALDVVAGTLCLIQWRRTRRDA